jgi:hypothetical protein
MCYPYRPALRLSPVATRSLYASSHDDAYGWTRSPEELHPASLPTQDAFLGYRWSYSGSGIVRTCSRDWTMMKRTRTALVTGKPRALCLTIGVRLPQSLSVTSCPVFAGPGPPVVQPVAIAPPVAAVGCHASRNIAGRTLRTQFPVDGRATTPVFKLDRTRPVTRPLVQLAASSMRSCIAPPSLRADLFAGIGGST